MSQYLMNRCRPKAQLVPLLAQVRLRQLGEFVVIYSFIGGPVVVANISNVMTRRKLLTPALNLLQD